MNGAPSVLLVDDHALIRDMFRERLEAEGFDVVVSGDTTEAIELAIEMQPDVAVLDIDMPGRSTFEVARMLSTELPATRVVFLSAFVRDAYIDQALAVQAAGYLCKCDPLEQILASILGVAAGGTCYSPEVLRRIVIDGSRARLRETKGSRSSTLTDRERDVLYHVARGLSQRQVARVLCISIKTVQHHLDSVMHKLDIHDRVELTRFAIREGIVEP